MSLNRDSQGTGTPEDFGNRIREAATRLGYSLSDLSRLTRMPKQSLSSYWNGSRFCGAERLFSIADVLGVDARWLIEGEPDVPVTEEAQLLESFIALDAGRRSLLLGLARALADGGGPSSVERTPTKRSRKRDDGRVSPADAISSDAVIARQ